jgi:cation diffusion facilitator family transporter
LPTRAHHQDLNHHDYHEHKSGHRLWDTIAEVLHLPGHAHTHAEHTHNDPFFNNELGIRTVKWALVLLGITTLIQVIIYVASGSVALLADTVHNLGDALNSIPLWIAFVLARRAANKRFTYGYGRAEDIAGLLIVVSIAFSAAYILWESIQKFIHPEPLTHLPWVAAAAVVGFLGNELVAVIQIRVGRKIGSEAMITDGRHARVDGLTSLSVLIAVIGAWLGAPILDPIIGILIGVAIVFITRDAVIAMWYRLMDAIDPALVEKAELVTLNHSAIQNIQQIRMRWIGHSLHLEATLNVDGKLSVNSVDNIVEEISHEMFHVIPNLSDITISIAADGKLPSQRMSAYHQHAEIP